MKLEEARILTKERVNKANETFGINKSLVVKIDKCDDAFGKWAEKNKDLDIVSLTPFDHFGVEGNIKECRNSRNSVCKMDPSCSTPRSNTTLFTSAWEEWIDRAKDWDIGNIKDELGLWYEVKDLCVIVLEVLDRSNIRVPCAHIPSVDCGEKCNYNEDLPANVCDDRFQSIYPELHGIIEGQGLCSNEEWSMPFKSNGETPNGMKEYIINMGPETKVIVRLIIPLIDCLRIIKGGKVTVDDFSAFRRGGGGIKRKKYKKTKKKRSKKRSYKKKRSKKRRTRKKRSKRISR